jgi:VRR-NUC domain
VNRLEEAECLAFMEWAQLATYDGKPLAGRIVHIANERDKGGWRIVKLLQLGMRKGFPDYAIMIPTPTHHGLYIEAKARNGRPSKEQCSWITLLQSWGYYAEVCHGFDEMRLAVHRYLQYGPGVFVDRTRIGA